jgi:WD40 repeat protein
LARQEGRRYLLATGVARYRQMPEVDLPAVAEDIDRISRLFTSRLGYQRVAGLEMNPTRDELEHGLRGFFRQADLQPADFVVVYYAGRSAILESGEHVLIPTDADPSDPGAGAVPTDEFARWMLEGTGVRQLLVLLDTCASGKGNRELLTQPLTEVEEPGVGVVTATRPMQSAEAGAFSSAFERAVDSCATAGHAPPWLPVDAVIGVLNRDRRVPGSQCVRLRAVSSEADLPAFIPNPRHDSRTVNVDLIGQQRILAQTDQAVEWFFAGRHRVLSELAAWLTRNSGDARMRAITGDPGSGKSAVLARLVLLGQEGSGRSAPPIHVAIDARNKTLEELLTAMSSAIGTTADTVGDFLEQLDAMPSAIVVVLDALDQAVMPTRVITELLRPLNESPEKIKLRLLVGTRRHLVPLLGDQVVVHDLDEKAYLERCDVAAYARRCLLDAVPRSPYLDASEEVVEAVSTAVAESAGRSFLVAGIVSRMLAMEDCGGDPSDPAWRDKLPRSAGAAMRLDLERLGEHAQRAWDLLVPLAFSEGDGLPWEDLWAPLASAASGRTYTDDDIGWLREHAGSYIVEGVEHGRSVYRLSHQALTDHLRQGVASLQVQRAMTRLLIQHASAAGDDAGDWTHAHPYIRASLAAHALAGEMIDELLTDPRYLLAADPSRLLPASRFVRAASARSAATAYRRSLHHLQYKPRAEHAAYLQLAAHCYGAEELADRIEAEGLSRPWSVRWARWRPEELAQILGWHAEPVSALRLREVNERPVVVSASANTVQVHELATGTLISRCASAHRDGVIVVDLADLEGRPVIVSGSVDGAVRAQEMMTGRTLTRLRVHKGWVTAVAAGKVDGHTFIATGGDDGKVQVLHFAGGTAISQPLTRHLGPIGAVAVNEVNGRTIIASGGRDRVVQVRDLKSGAAVCDPLTGHAGPIASLAIGELHGRMVIVSGGYDSRACIWELEAGKISARQVTSHRKVVSAVTLGRLDGQDVAVSWDGDRSARCRNLQTGATVRASVTAHDDPVSAATLGELDGHPVVVTGNRSGMIMAWELGLGSSQYGTEHSGRPAIEALSIGELRASAVVVSGDNDGNVAVRQLTTGAMVRPAVQMPTGEVIAIRAEDLHGTSVLLSGHRTGLEVEGDGQDARQRDLQLGETPFSAMTLGRIGHQPFVAVADYRAVVRIVELYPPRTVQRVSLRRNRGSIDAQAAIQIDHRLWTVAGYSSGVVALFVSDIGSGNGSTSRTRIFSGRSAITALSLVEADGHPIMVMGTRDGSVQVFEIPEPHGGGVIPLRRRVTPGKLRPLAIWHHDNEVTDTAIARYDDRLLVASAGRDNTIRLVVPGQPEMTTIDLDSPVTAVAVGPSETMAAATLHGIVLIDLGAAQQRLGGRRR